MSQAVNVFISAAELDSLTHCWSLKWQSLRTAVFGPREVKEESAQCLVQLLCWSCTRIEHSAKIRSVTTARGLPLETNVFTQAAKYGLLQRVTHCTYSAKTLVQIPQEHRGSGCYANRRESLCKPNPANVTSGSTVIPFTWCRRNHGCKTGVVWKWDGSYATASLDQLHVRKRLIIRERSNISNTGFQDDTSHDIWAKKLFL